MPDPETTGNTEQICMSNEQFSALLQTMQNTLLQQVRASTPVQAVNIQGSFAKCTHRFEGKKDSDINAFIDAIETYKECMNIPDELALKGLPILLTDLAATWWQGVKATTATWTDAVALLKHTFGPKKPPYRVYRELFSHEQDDKTLTDVFVCQCRALLAQLPRGTLTETSEIDMVYGLLSVRIRREVPREKINTFSELLDQARRAEDNFIENESTPKQSKENIKLRPKCKYCKTFGHVVEECRRLQNKNEGTTSKNVFSSPNDTSASSKPTDSKYSKNVPMISCFGCGNPGYVRKDCPKCKSKTENQGKSEFCSLDTINISQVPRRRPIINVEICGAKGTGYVDTAAKQSVAGYTLYQLLLRKGQTFQKSSLYITLADGQQNRKDVLLTHVEVLLQGRTILTTFLIFPEAQNNVTLFGMDFIEDAQLVLNIPQRIWNFAGETNFFDLNLEEMKSNDNVLELNLLSTLTLREDEGTSLTVDQKDQLNQLIEQNSDIFSPGGVPTPFAEHRIETGDHAPIAVPPYRMSAQKKEILEKELENMMQEDIIEECESPWAAPVVLVPKKNNEVRVCVDYRRLNAVTIGDSYPLPRIDELLHLAKQTLYMTTIDLRSGYWQVSVRECDKDKTAFTTPFGTFRFKRMPFGLRNSAATFQRLIDRFRGGLKDITTFAYLDDLIVISDSFEKHLSDLDSVFRRLRKFQLRAKREKCVFVCAQVKYLGHLITTSGIKPDPDKISAIADMRPPRNVKQLLSFIQTCSWFRRFVANFAEVAQPLTKLTKKNATWEWSKEQQSAFDKLKTALVSSPILRQADEKLPFIIRTDASNYAIGAALLQGEGADERPIEYASRLLTDAERNYNTTEREALALKWAVDEKFRGYIEGADVIVATDHQALRWLMTLKSPSGRLARWALALQPYNLKITYTPGRCNVLADTLSRPVGPEEEEKDHSICSFVTDLPSKSPKDLRNEQLSDPEVKKIIDAFETPDHPDLPNWIARGYIMDSGVLYRYVPEEEADEAQLVVPECSRADIMMLYHDAPTAGHFGYDRTLRKISSRYFWIGMRKYVKDYIKNCTECQRYKPSNLKPAGLLKTPVVNQRFETLAIDLFGPLPITSEGYQWIFIVEDVATKWIEIFPLKQATADMCARTLIDEVILRYGTPRRVISDNGVQFVGAVMQCVSFCLGFEQCLTPVYHPEANPVERKNRDMKTQLSILVEEDHTDWVNKLPSIRFAMNSSFTQSTGYTPAFLNFARELRTPDDVQKDLRSIVLSENFVPEITPYLLQMAETLKDVRDTKEREQDLHKKYADVKRRPVLEFTEGDLVWVRTHVLSKSSQSITSKFVPKRDGPYKIHCKISSTTYEVCKPDDNIPIAKYHISDLTPYKSTDNTDQPKPIFPIRKRGRPPKKNLPDVAGPPPRTFRHSRGGACNK